jgi:hypothetical protein
MSRVKVRCGYCGRQMGEVIAAPHGLTCLLPGGGTASGPAGLLCPDHGWPDLATETFTTALMRAWQNGKATTHAAKMLPRPPAPS